MNKLNRLAFCVFAALCGLFWLCERSDVVTGAGGGVVGSGDPSLSDPAAGFMLARVGAEAADSAFSLPAAADPAFSTQFAAYALMGISAHGDTLASHALFMARPFAASKDTPPYGKADSAGREAFLFFRAFDEEASFGPIAVYRSDTLTPQDPVDRSVVGQYTDEESGELKDARIGVFALSGGIDSIRLSDDIAKSIFDARTSGDTSATHLCAFSIAGYHGELRKTRSPHIILQVSKNGETVRDSIPGRTRFTVFENTGDGRAAEARSYQHSKRTAVFRINIDTLRTLGLSDGRSELVSAVIAVKPQRPSEGNGNSKARAGDAPEAAISYKAVVLDTLITNELDITLMLDGENTAMAAGLLRRFDAVRPSTPAEPYNTHSIEAPLRSAMKKYNAGDAVKPCLYVYLRPVTDDSMILWDGPLFIETIFTPSRSTTGK